MTAAASVTVSQSDLICLKSQSWVQRCTACQTSLLAMHTADLASCCIPCVQGLSVKVARGCAVVPVQHPTHFTLFEVDVCSKSGQKSETLAAAADGCQFFTHAFSVGQAVSRLITLFTFLLESEDSFGVS